MGKITLATILHNPDEATMANVKNVYQQAEQFDVQRVVIDNSGCNVGYGGGINKAVEQATGDYFVYFSAKRTKVYNPNWIARIIEPLSDPNCGMAGSVVPCDFNRIARRACDIWDPQIHVQGGIFAARTQVLRENPWSDYFPQVFSDVWQGWNLMKSGFYFFDVPQVASEAGGIARSAWVTCDYRSDALLDEEFERRCITEFNINEHGRTLRDLAARSNRIVEFGVRDGFSTIFLLAGRPRTMASYDVDPLVSAEHLMHLIPSVTKFTFGHADSRAIEIPITDLLFIDTDHTYEVLMAELNHNCNKVTRRIACHDTEAYAGCKQAINDFVAVNSEWRILKHYTNNNGLTILERQQGYAR